MPADAVTGARADSALMFINVHLATMAGEHPYGVVEDGAVVVSQGRLAWVGPRENLPADMSAGGTDVFDCGGGTGNPAIEMAGGAC